MILFEKNFILCVFYTYFLYYFNIYILPLGQVMNFLIRNAENICTRIEIRYYETHIEFYGYTQIMMK